jgi:hypothetical protein
MNAFLRDDANARYDARIREAAHDWLAREARRAVASDRPRPMARLVRWARRRSVSVAVDLGPRCNVHHDSLMRSGATRPPL